MEEWEDHEFTSCHGHTKVVTIDEKDQNLAKKKKKTYITKYINKLWYSQVSYPRMSGLQMGE